jgi:hypothetical protein
VPFGRVGTDEVRIAIIGRDRSLPADELFERIDDGFERWTRRLSTLTPEEWTRSGSHPARGDMTIDAIVGRMVVAHTEEHASQLEGLLDTAAG